MKIDGVAEYCVCAGSRNAPLIAQLGDAKTFAFVDERAAAFFALGRIKLHGKPVAVVTTSGTAAAELLPATIEAFYAGLPLVLVTADRPARFRGTGAPQSIEQVGLFGPYAATSFDDWNGKMPLHINVEVEEFGLRRPQSPLSTAGAEQRPATTTRSLAKAAALPHSKPLVILGGHAERARDFVLKLNAPIYAEPLSGLREDTALQHLMITSGERMIARGKFDGVVRIGNVPTLRFWRDLEETRTDLPVIHFSDLPFTGLTRGELHPIDALPDVTPLDRDDAFFAEDREHAARFTRILDDEPQSELAMLRALDIPKNARVYLGNSLPIREWDLVASREPRGTTIEANRGANGIDGQLSTFFGQCDRARENVCIIGDLTALYDLNAPWIVPQLDASFRIVIINNRGGRIFDRVASLRAMDKRLIVNEHALRFDAWARMFGIEDRMTELVPDLDATRRVWERYDALWA